MDKDKVIKEYIVGTVSLSLASLLIARAKIEVIKSGENSYYFNPVVFLIGRPQNKSRRGYEKEGINVLMSINELRALSYAMKDIVRVPDNNGTKEVPYEKISNSGIMKKVFLGYKNGNYYINMRLFSNPPKMFSIGADKYRFISFSDSLYNLSDEVEKALLTLERKKSVNK